MSRILVWDLPTRLFHWLLAGAFFGAYGIAELADDDSRLFQMHMLLGLIVAFLVVLRLLWGLAGTRYARFGSFAFGLRALVGYLRDLFRRTGARHVGHNPGSAYAVYAMLLLPLGIAVSGLLLPTFKGLEEPHEVMAHLMLVTAAVHVVGVIWHTIRHRENIALSMIDGKKEGEASQAIASSRPLAGAALVTLTAGWAFLVFAGHDAPARQLTLFGQTVRLGEVKQEKGGRDEDHGARHHRGRHREHGDHRHRGHGDHHERGDD
jgi:cytochrome b